MTEVQKAKLAIDELEWLIKKWRSAKWWRRSSLGYVIVLKLSYRFPEIASTVANAERHARSIAP